ncbi:MAG: motility associated factor glycosyltransferase family protein, partial [Campylobacteraceae bacterium]|nr:motility associated factor glycosyltransferase family protein [Campylobacteraceae bacterium]
MSQEEAEQQLQNSLINTYHANLLFLCEYDNNLYKRIDALSNVINTEEYKERFVLEFNKNDGDFDIYDIEHNIYLYDKKPKKNNNQSVNNINFDTKGSFSIFDPSLLNGKKFKKLDKETIFDKSARELSEDINEFHNIFDKEKFDFTNKKFKKINKFIFIGTLLGRHIPSLMQKTSAKIFFVCEENLEIFRLSLFVVDYSNLARDDKRVVFSIMEDKNTFNNKFLIFLENLPYDNFCMKYYSTNYNTSSYFDPIVDMISISKSTVFNHHLVLDNISKLAFERVNKYNIIQARSTTGKSYTLEKNRVLFLAAGPSLDENIEWVLKNKSKFIIVCIAASLYKLYKYGIIPDIVTTLDPQFDTIFNNHFRDELMPKLGNTIVLASMNTDQRVLDKFNQDNLYLFEVMNPLHSTSAVNGAFTVGEMTVSLLLDLEVKELYMIGFDLALNQETGATHSIDYFDNKMDIKNIITLEDKDTFSLKEDLLYIKGNLREKVVTTRMFKASVDVLSKTLSSKNKIKIYNLSSNGAFINETIPTKIDDINVDDFEDVKNELKKDFQNFSKNKLDEKYMSFLKVEKDSIFEIIKFIEETKNNKYNNFDE